MPLSSQIYYKYTSQEKKCLKQKCRTGFVEVVKLVMGPSPQRASYFFLADS